MKKVLIIQEYIAHYRVPVFNALSKVYDLTVLYSEGKEPENITFKIIKVETLKLRQARLHKKNIIKLANKFDAVIIMLDFSFLYFRLMPYFKRKYKLIFWGIGVTAGYNCRYDSVGKNVITMSKFIKRADAAVFYSDYPIEKYKAAGIEEEKLFAAHNTVEVKTNLEKTERDILLFVGSLYKQKRIYELLENYKKAYEKQNKIYSLYIIGDGDLYDEINVWILQNNLESKVFLTKGIYDEDELAAYFSRAVCCISPDQAGLSVLKSMGYGVPFVTSKNAITGGEIFNIKDKENGILFDDFSELENIISDSYYNKDKFLAMGENAKNFYQNFRTVDKMVGGFVEAIEYVLKN